MMASPSLDTEMQLRLSHDCAEHEQTIVAILAAQREGLLDADVAFQQCAMELHSIKGVASVLELEPVTSAIGTLCDVMLRQNPSFSATFLQDFGSWFQLLVSCLRSSAQGKCDRAMIQAARVRQCALLGALSVPGSAATKKREPTPHGWALSPSAGRRLLVIDDSRTICAALLAQFRQRGYPVRTAQNLLQTADLLATFAPEIVVTDVHMPDVEGDELCRRIKAQMTRVVPVVLYSILPEEQLAERARAAGADAYVHKGLGVEALIRRMDELLSDEILF